MSGPFTEGELTRLPTVFDTGDPNDEPDEPDEPDDEPGVIDLMLIERVRFEGAAHPTFRCRGCRTQLDSPELLNTHNCFII